MDTAVCPCLNVDVSVPRLGFLIRLLRPLRQWIRVISALCNANLLQPLEFLEFAMDFYIQGERVISLLAAASCTFAYAGVSTYQSLTDARKQVHDHSSLLEAGARVHL